MTMTSMASMVSFCSKSKSGQNHFGNKIHTISFLLDECIFWCILFFPWYVDPIYRWDKFISYYHIKLQLSVFCCTAVLNARFFKIMVFLKSHMRVAFLHKYLSSNCFTKYIPTFCHICFFHPIFLYFGRWYFGHFTCVIFFPFFSVLPILPCNM